MRGRKPSWTLKYWCYCKNKKCGFYQNFLNYRLEVFDDKSFCFNCGEKLWKQCAKCKTKVITPVGDTSRFCENCGQSHFKGGE